ncbi:MAG: hypothetical protein VW455_10550 [Nitrospinota bacterium]
MGKKSGSKRNWDNDNNHYPKFDEEYPEFSELVNLNDFEEFEDSEYDEDLKDFKEFGGYSMYPFETSFLKPERIRNKESLDSPRNNQLNNKPKRSSRKKK